MTAPKLLLALLLPLATSQPQPTDAPPLTFEVASIHLSKPGQAGGFIKALPGGQQYKAQNIPVKLMISLMYKIPMRQILGGPDWINTEGYDVEAKADHGYTTDDLHVMYQNLLVERFNIKFHIETKEGNVYALTLDTPGSKMTPNATPQDFNIPVNFTGQGLVAGKRVPMPYLTWWLGQALQHDARPVVDMTGLAGNFDFQLSFAPQLPPDVDRDTLPAGLLDRPSIFDAVRQQLGLKLTAQKGPVVYYVIDGIDRPTAN